MSQTPSTPDLSEREVLPPLDLRTSRRTRIIDDVPGTIVDRYRLVRELGSGAFGVVWWAADTILNRPVALKLFKDDLADPNPLLWDRVVYEARATARIASPYVVQMLDAGRLRDGSHFIAMELFCDAHPPGEEFASGISRPITGWSHRESASATTVVGSTLQGMHLSDSVTAVAHHGEVQRRLRRQALPGIKPVSLEEAVQWIAVACRGVQAAHDVNIFHRDIKPSNILCTPKARRVKVTDFGLAVAGPDQAPVEFEADAFVAYSVRGRVIAGTPAYMAPEQATGLPDDLDPVNNGAHRQVLSRIDVYGLGASLWALLAGRPPRMSTLETRRDLRALVCNDIPLLTSIPAAFAVPPRLAMVVDRAVQQTANNRHASPADLADDLENFLDGMLTSVDRGVSIRMKLAAARLRRRPRQAAAAGAVAGAVMAAGYGGWTAYDWIGLTNLQLSSTVATLDSCWRASGNTNQALSTCYEERQQDLEALHEDAAHERQEVDNCEAAARDQLRRLRRTLRETEADLGSCQAEKQVIKSERDSANRILAIEAKARLDDKAYFQKYWVPKKE